MVAQVSIIIPVYNAEKYIGRCIESILKQTYTKLEMLLVDDCSQDKTVELINQYVQKDARVHLFLHQKNCGPAAARNTGLENAIGKWIFFVDSDDYIECNMIQKMVCCMETKDVQLTVCDFYDEHNERYYVDKTERKSIDSYKKEYIYNFPPTTYVGSNANKCYAGDIIRKYNLRYDEKKRYAEDLLFNLSYIRYAKNVYILKEKLYHYVDNNGSLSGYRDFENSLIRYENVYKETLNILREDMTVPEKKKYRDGYLIAVSNVYYDAVRSCLPIKTIRKEAILHLSKTSRQRVIDKISYCNRYPYNIVWVMLKLHLYGLIAYFFYFAKHMRAIIEK